MPVSQPIILIRKIMQHKLLDLTCTHAQTLHATDCKDCIQLVNDITELFIEEGWRVPQKPLDQEKVGELLDSLWYRSISDAKVEDVRDKLSRIVQPSSSDLKMLDITEEIINDQ